VALSASVSVCLSVREDISEPHARSLPNFFENALSAGKGDGTGSVQRGRSMLSTVALLWSPYGIGETIIFLPCGYFFLSFFFLFFFPRIISAVADWKSAILPHMVWP